MKVFSFRSVLVSICSRQTLVLLMFVFMASSSLCAQTERVDSIPISSKKPFRFAVKSNLLYDAALVPNIGVEFPLKNGWSVSANWMYAWWHNDSSHWYWRIYGGDVAVRKWFGKKHEDRVLSGHHVGLYGQIVTYDFEWGGRGYLADKWTYGGGLEYGYSLPIGKRLNLDFTLGIGYLGGEYMEYDPIDRCYVWQFTKKQNWIGPTKAEVTLVWLLDSSMFKKGGKR